MRKRFWKSLFQALVVEQLAGIAAYLFSKKSKDGDQERATAWRRIRQAFRSSVFHRHFYINLCIGLMIAVVLHFAAYSCGWSFVATAEDGAVDLVMRQYQNVRRKENTAFVLLEIDEPTYELWDRPFYTHRSRLANLLEEVASGNPALILVDIELSKSGDDTGFSDRIANSDAPIEDSEAPSLYKFLQAYSENASNPPLLLVRTLQAWTPDRPEDSLPSQRSSYLDGVVSASDNIFWVSPHFQRDEDYRIRRWLLWLASCDSGQGAILPSVQLFADVLLRDEWRSIMSPAEMYDSIVRGNLYAAAASGTPSKCSWNPETGTAGASERFDSLFDREYELDNKDLIAQRLIYSIPYDVQGRRRPTVELSVPAANGEGADSRRVPILERESAGRLGNIDSESLFAGRVVVIGGTYRDTRDWHATPIGEMPGAMVVINAIHSLRVHGQLHKPDLWQILLIEAFLIFMMSVLFAALDSVLAFVLSSAGILLVLLPISFLAFRSGVWVTFALPLLAVQLHQVYRLIEDARTPEREMPDRTTADTEDRDPVSQPEATSDGDGSTGNAGKDR
jgi:CHASE2 domain-containing sensor protein